MVTCRQMHEKLIRFLWAGAMIQILGFRLDAAAFCGISSVQCWAVKKNLGQIPFQPWTVWVEKSGRWDWKWAVALSVLAGNPAGIGSGTGRWCLEHPKTLSWNKLWNRIEMTLKFPHPAVIWNFWFWMQNAELCIKTNKHIYMYDFKSVMYSFLFKHLSNCHFRGGVEGAELLIHKSGLLLV